LQGTGVNSWQRPPIKIFIFKLGVNLYNLALDFDPVVHLA